MQNFPIIPAQWRPLIVALGLWCFASELYAQSTLDFTYEGRLTEDSGKPINGPIAMEVAFFREASGGSAVLTVTSGLEAVPLQEGVFQLKLSLSASDYHTVFSSVSQAVYVQITDLTHARGRPYDRQRVGLLPYAAKIPVDGKTLTFSTDGKAKLAVSGTPAAGQFLTFDGSGQLVWSTPTVAGVTQVGGALAADVATASTLANGATTASTGDTLVKRDSNGGFATGKIVAQAPLSTQQALVLKGAATQSAALQEWQDSTGGVLTSILADGSLKMKQSDSGTNYVTLKGPVGLAGSVAYTLPGSPDAGKYLTTDVSGVMSWATPAASSVAASSVTGLTAKSVPFVDTPATSGLSEDPVSFVWDKVKKALGLGTATPTETLTVKGGSQLGQAPTAATTVAVSGLTIGATTLTVGSTTGYPTSGTLVIDSEAMTYSGLTATTFTGLSRGVFGTAAAAHSAAATVNNALLLLVGSSASTPKLTALGNGKIGVGTLTPSGQLEVVASSDQVVQVARGNSTQTADLVQWQNNAGVALSAIAADGSLKMKDSTTNYLTLKAPSSLGANTTYTLPGSIQANKYLTTDSSGNMSWADIGSGGAAAGSFTSVTTAAASASSVPATVKGASAQTANLQEWQSSTGSVLTKIDKDGYLTLPGVPTSANQAATKGYIDTALLGLDTAAIPENAAHLYYTSARAKAEISATAPLSYSITTGQMDLGTVPLSKGGTGADLSATGGAGKYLKQSTSGGNVSVGTIGAGDLPVMVASGTGHAAGAVPDPGSSAGTTKFLREDGTWQAPAGASAAYGAHASAAASSVYVDSSGGVGIGTTSPGSALDVGGNFQVASNGNILKIGGTSNAHLSAGALGLSSSGGDASVANGSPTASSSLYLKAGVGAGSVIKFATEGSEKVRIDNSGNVGIGTTSPQATLHVKGQVVSMLPPLMLPIGTTQVINWSAGNIQPLDLSSATGDVTMTFNGAVAGGSYAIKITQGSTARAIIWPTSVKWPGGAALVPSTGAGAVDLVSLFYDGANYYAVGGKNFQ